MRLEVYDERRGAFAALRDRGVLVYWPHGFGDFVHFGYVVPALETSNRYAITRFGDGFTHLYDGASGIEPLYTGVERPTHGPERFEHLGITFKRIANREMEVAMPPPLSEHFFKRNLDTLLYTDYPEFEGNKAFPFHTKARSLLAQLAGGAATSRINLNAPLRNALRLRAPEAARAAVLARLETMSGGRRIVTIAPGGHTNVGKSWPKDSAGELAGRLAKRGIGAALVDEEEFAQNFGDLHLPFAHVLVTLIERSAAFVGVAAGPLHLALAMGGRPTIGLWRRHYPDWYDEPCADALHFVSAEAIRDGLHERLATTTKPEAMRDRIVHVEEDVIAVERVDAALRDAGV